MAVDPIISALDEQVACYRRLAKLAEIQHEHVQFSRVEELLEVLGRRQDVLDDIGRLEQAIAPAKRRWPQYVAALEANDRGRAEGLLGETRRLLESITATDRDDALVLQQRKLSLGKQINQASSAKQVNRTYAASAYGPRPGRVDLSR